MATRKELVEALRARYSSAPPGEKAKSLDCLECEAEAWRFVGAQRAADRLASQPTLRRMPSQSPLSRPCRSLDPADVLVL